MEQEIFNVINENAYCDYSNNIASDDEIEDFVKNINIELPNEYLDFIKSLNGFELNGLNFYGTKEQENIYVLSIDKQNDFWTNEIPALKGYLLLGDGDMDFYCYSASEKKYFVFSKGSMEKCAEFENFSSLMDYLTETYI